MPGDRPHHSEEFRRCVDKVTAKGDADNAYAVCTAAFQKADKPIFESMAAGGAEENRALEEAPFRACIIKQINGKWVLFSKDMGKRLGIHATKEEALAQERAIEANKHRAAIEALEASADDQEVRHLHLLGAVGTVRTVTDDGKEYLVVPVVALMEGVVHAVNADTPEFVPLATLERAALTWIDKPAVLNHPTKNGRQCSADDPDIQASHAFGVVKKSRVEGKKLLMDVWVDPDRARCLGGDTFLRRLQHGEQVEVSVGAYVSADHKEGHFNGRPYKGTWLVIAGDHLAFLPNGRGACSLEMGCGAHRAASHFITEHEMFIPSLKAAECNCQRKESEGMGNHDMVAMMERMMTMMQRVMSAVEGEKQ